MARGVTSTISYNESLFHRLDKGKSNAPVRAMQTRFCMSFFILVSSHKNGGETTGRKRQRYRGEVSNNTKGESEKISVGRQQQYRGGGQQPRRGEARSNAGRGDDNDAKVGAAKMPMAGQ